MIFYKYAEGDGYSMYISSDEDNPENQSARDAIVRRLMGAVFSLADISKEFYRINVTPDIVFFGDRLTQYDIEPLSKDRFAHIIWVDNLGRLIKTEVYDINKRLVLAFSRMDFASSGKGSFTGLKGRRPVPDADKPFYKGFYNVFNKRKPGGELHMFFGDGLNKFSVFIKPESLGNGSVSKIIYGNYLLSKVVSGIEYTVVGSVPYGFMEDMIEVIDSHKVEIFPIAEKGRPITEDLLKKN